MESLLKNEAILHGDRLQIIPSYHLSDLKNDIEEFAQGEKLNDFQNWIIKSLYDYNIPDMGFPVQSIILMALSHPFYADLVFKKSGREYPAKCLVRSDFEGADKYLKEFLGKYGYHAECAGNLPLKRLGVQSGLSEYGRNNITYIEGMGSNFSLAAYFSDMPWEVDSWRKAAHAKVCEHCNICINNCPTGAIRKESFLIDNQRCLSAINEVPGEFPEWLPSSVHHTCYDCLRCQEKCPMNTGHMDRMAECLVFSEQETEMLLQGSEIESFSENTKKNIYTLGLDQWYSAIPRNIKALMNNGQAGSLSMDRELFMKPGVGGIIERITDGKKYILIQERYKEDAPAEEGLIEIPAGKIREFENIYDCLRREVKEETGLDVVEIEGEAGSVLFESNGYRVLSYEPFASAQNIGGTYPIMVQVFVCRVEGEPVAGTNETKFLRWVTLEELECLLENHWDRFYPMHVNTLRKYIRSKA